MPAVGWFERCHQTQQSLSESAVLRGEYDKLKAAHAKDSQVGDISCMFQSVHIRRAVSTCSFPCQYMCVLQSVRVHVPVMGHVVCTCSRAIL